MKIYSETLDNGMHMLFLPTPNLNSVALTVAVNYGMMNAENKKVALPHILEHLLFTGTSKRSEEEIQAILRKYGISSNAMTANDYTMYYMQVYKSYVNKAADLLADMIINSTLSAISIRNQKEVVRSEYIMYLSNAFDMALSDLNDQLLSSRVGFKFGYRQQIESISNISAKDFLEAYRKHYTPKNMTLTIVGNLKASDAKKLGERYFGSFQNAGSNAVAEEGVSKQEEESEAKENFTEAGIALGRLIDKSNANPKELAKWMLLSKAIDDAMFDYIREEKGLSYWPHSDIDISRTYAYIYLYANSKKENSSKVEESINTLLTKLDTNADMLSKYINNARKEIAIEQKLAEDNTLKTAIRLSEYSLSGNKELFDFVSNLRSLKSISKREIEEALKELRRSDTVKVKIIPK